MKVAVVLTGHMREWKTVFPNFKEKIIDRYNPDIFIHTWDNEGYWINSSESTNPHSPELDVAGVKKAYNPVGILVENFDDYDAVITQRASKFKNFSHKPKNIVSMYYGISSGVHLLEKYCALTGVKYDLVIRMRPDMILHEDLPEFDPNNFYTIYHKSGDGLGTGDMFQASSFFNILSFSKIGIMLEEIYEKTNLFCPHVLGDYFIKSLGVPHVEINMNKTLQHTPNGQYNDWNKV